MLTEIRGKAGAICSLAKSGQLHCPLIVRPTSEDVITGHLFGTLGVVNPRWWVPDLLNAALGSQRFRRQMFRKFSVQLWRPRPPYPRELLPWDEGSTEVDVTLNWENPKTTVYIEMKYGSELSAKTSGDNGSHGFPSDQLIRNIRVGLLECGYFERNDLFEMPTRDFAVIVVSPYGQNSLVARYRDAEYLRAAIPKSHCLKALPRRPFVGQLRYRDIRGILTRQRTRMLRTERILVDRLIDYLEFKEYHLHYSPKNGSA